MIGSWQTTIAFSVGAQGIDGLICQMKIEKYWKNSEDDLRWHREAG